MIEVTIKVNEKAIKKLVKNAGYKITDEAAFEKLLKSPKFAKAMGADMRDTWLMMNDEGEDLDAVIEGLGLDAVTDFDDSDED